MNEKAKLKKILKIEKKIYKEQFSMYNIVSYLRADIKWLVWPLIKNLRKSEYFYEKGKKNKFYYLFHIFYGRRKNKLALKLNIELPEGVFDEGLTIYHTSGIVVNGCAKVGKNCMLHGNNVIGNKGTSFGAPIIGNNVRIGTGARILGNVYIADDVTIAAGAVVVKDCYEKGALLVGVPATIKEK